MLKESDEQWLRDTHPALIRAGHGIAGTVRFRACYNRRDDRFFILDDRAIDPSGALTLSGAFQIRAFLEQLVIPFLYGQVFYSSKNRWPWAEYAHGATGILEAYSKTRDQ